MVTPVSMLKTLLGEKLVGFALDLLVGLADDGSGGGVLSSPHDEPSGRDVPADEPFGMRLAGALHGLACVDVVELAARRAAENNLVAVVDELTGGEVAGGAVNGAGPAGVCDLAQRGADGGIEIGAGEVYLDRLLYDGCCHEK